MSRPRGIVPSRWFSRSDRLSCFPDVFYFLLSKSISLLLMPAPQPVSFCCISCLLVCKCGSKHTGIERKLIVFDTCSEAGQLFATGGKLVFFFSSNTSPNKAQRGLPSPCTFSRKLSVRHLRTNLWSVCASLICILSPLKSILGILKNTRVNLEPPLSILSAGHSILHTDVLLETDVSPFLKRGSKVSWT